MGFEPATSRIQAQCPNRTAMLPQKNFSNLVPSYFRPGYQKIVPSEGMPISKDPATKGDLIIQFNIEFPNQLNPEQKRMLKEALLLPPWATKITLYCTWTVFIMTSSAVLSQHSSVTLVKIFSFQLMRLVLHYFEVGVVINSRNFIFVHNWTYNYI